MDATDARVEDLFAPTSLAAFASDYWGVKPLHIPGSPDKLQRLFGSVPTVADILAIVTRATTAPARICAFFQNRHTRRRRDQVEDLPRMDARADQVAALLAAGATVSLYRAECVEPVFAHWAAHVRTTLQHAGEMTCSLWMSSPQVGMYTHFDTFSSVHVQLVGTKIWQLSPSAHVVAPRSAAVISEDGTAEIDETGFEPRRESIDSSSFLRVTMRPGDVLYVPAGVWHQTECAGDDVSISVAFEPQYTSVRNLFAAYLSDHFAADESWRYLPIAPLDDADAEARLNRFFAARIDDAISALTRLRERPLQLARMWKRSIAGNGTIEDRVLVRPPIEASVEPDDLLSPPTGQPITASPGEARDGKPALFVYQGSEEILFDDPELFDFGTRLARAGTFSARDACSWRTGNPYPWEQVRELLEALVSNGILEKR